jgi:hypothetical protein
LSRRIKTQAATEPSFVQENQPGRATKKQENTRTTSRKKKKGDLSSAGKFISHQQKVAIVAQDNSTLSERFFNS